MDFSSSSDAELEEELNRNLRRERREERGIVRTASSARAQARRHTLPDGQSIEIRRGCIYIPSREIYVHVLQALRCPQRWFGDGRTPMRRRPPLSPDTVELLSVSDRAGASPRSDVISLATATENGFFVFQAVQSSGLTAASPAAAVVDAVTAAPPRKLLADPFVDVRFQRMTHLSEWRFALQHRPALQEHQHDAWSASAVTVHSHEVCCYDEALGLLWKFDAQSSALSGVRYLADSATLCEAPLARIPFPTQSCIGMQVVPERGDEAQTVVVTRRRLIIVGVAHLAFVSLTVRDCPAQGASLPCVTKTRVQTVALFLSNVTCWGTHRQDPTREFPDLWIGAGRGVFTFSQLDSGQWSKSRRTLFLTTDVTALGVRAATASVPPLAVAGMRNGTLQLLDDGARRHTAFDTTARHKGSDVKFVFAVPDAPCSFVSIARDGEAKVWDVRLLSAHKEAVHTLLTSRPDGGQAGVCSAALTGHLLAVSSMSTGLTCVDLPLYSTLFHTDRNISSTTRIALGTTGRGGYELYSFSPYFTQRFELCE